MSMVVFSYLAFRMQVDLEYTVFIGSGTMVTYGLHRIVGARKSAQFQSEGRFAIVKQFLSHIKLYCIVAFAVALVSFFMLTRYQQIMLVLLSSISLLYTLPIFTNGKRLRDFAFIKIFLVSIIWALTTGGLILLGDDASLQYLTTGLVYSLSLYCYIMAITLPFDVRDLAVDKELNVSTIPSRIGRKWTLRLSLILLFFAMTFIFLLPISAKFTGSLTITYLLSGILIWKVQNQKHDYWYSGLLDATMMLPLISLLIFG